MQFYVVVKNNVIEKYLFSQENSYNVWLNERKDFEILSIVHAYSYTHR